jgi:ribosomal protein L22
MKAFAIQRNVHISAQKAKLVCDLIRNQPIKQAQVILTTTDKKVSAILLKLLNSAIANATNNHGLEASNLYIYQIYANQGSSVKRTMPRAKGSADVRVKRYAHLEIILSDDKNQATVDKNSKVSNKKVKNTKEIVYAPEKKGEEK